jgi:hypothetical protein
MKAITVEPKKGGSAIRSVNGQILAIENDQTSFPIASLDFNTQAIGTADGDYAESRLPRLFA